MRNVDLWQAGDRRRGQKTPCIEDLFHHTLNNKWGILLKRSSTIYLFIVTFFLLQICT